MEEANKKNILEEGMNLDLDYKKLSLLKYDILPVIVQSASTEDVLMLAYVNELALKQSFLEQRAIFWSTSRNSLWVKGESSGDYLDLVDVRVNCEQNSLLFRVLPRTGRVCHTFDEKKKHRKTCYYRRLRRSDEGEMLGLEGL